MYVSNPTGRSRMTRWGLDGWCRVMVADFFGLLLVVRLWGEVLVLPLPFLVSSCVMLWPPSSSSSSPSQRDRSMKEMGGTRQRQREKEIGERVEAGKENAT